MVKKKDVDYYCGFSRKGLQSLCKQYSLPANRSSLDMAESLASFFEKNSLGFGVPRIQDGIATTSTAPWGVKRDSYGNELNIAREGCFQSRVARGPGFILGDSTQSQERNGGLKLNEKGPIPMDPQLENRMKEVESGDSPSSSSFEFHVSMEEGISLSVDLNFNPSDWVNSMRNEVNVYDSMRPRKPPHSDLGIDNVTTSKKQKSSEQDKDEHVRRESSTSPTVKENTQVSSDHHSNAERSLPSSAIQPCLVNGVNLSVPDSSGPGQIVSSCAESCSKSCCVNPVDLECVDPPGKKLTSDSVMVAAEQNHQAGDLLVENPQNPSMESFQKVGNSSTVLCPRGAGSELSSSEAEAYPSHAMCSPRKTSMSSNISSSELIIDRDSTSYSESFKFRYNGVKNCLPPDSEEQEKSEVFSEQARLE
ncbi:unnamed protein product [Eruca vesicaria subsp. sativa]|uniref:Uncharacterized protein n=1 Tax=Eruca vesicaria subsp. sativa TaxID=29727 RepID=A0ABC8LKQ1_ERUVS|nr:unnamed protein product [Eruca vesicaria subsp. sativa]